MCIRDRLGDVRAGQVRRHPLHVVGQRVVHHQLGHGRALGVVAVQQAGAGLAGEHRGELPGQVVAVLHGGVATHAAGGWGDLGRVTGQEDATDPEGVGDPGRHLPGLHAPDDRLQLGRVGGDPNQLDQPPLGELLGRLAAFRVVLHGEDMPAAGLVGGAQHPGERGVLQVEQGDLVGLDQFGQVGLEDHADVVGQRAPAVRGDVQLAPDRAAPAVRGDQVVGPDRAQPAGRPVQHPRGHPGPVLLDRHHLGVEPHPRAQLLRLPQQLSLIHIGPAWPCPRGRARRC